MKDIIDQIKATHREIGTQAVSTGAGRSLLLRRTYDATIADVWNACTDRDRLGRWLGPVEGDLQLGGTFALQDNASGEILSCEEPHRLKVTWGLGEGMVTEVELRLAPTGDGGTLLELEHATAAEVLDEMVRAYGPGGTIGIGGGWDLTLLALDQFLAGVPFDPATWEDTREARAYAVDSCYAWGRAVQAAWGTSDQDLAAAIDFGVQHFAPDPADAPHAR